MKGLRFETLPTKGVERDTQKMGEFRLRAMEPHGTRGIAVAVYCWNTNIGGIESVNRQQGGKAFFEPTDPDSVKFVVHTDGIVLESTPHAFENGAKKRKV